MTQDEATTPLAALDERRRGQVMARFAVLRPHLENDVPLTHAADHAGVPVRTVERWLARYREAASLAWPVSPAATPVRVGCLRTWLPWLKAWR